MKKMLFAVTLLPFFSPITVLAEEKVTDNEILLVCTMENKEEVHYFVLNERDRVVKDVGRHIMRVGELTTTENTFIVHLPRTEKTYEMRHTINRYSGILDWEHGVPPFGEQADHNIYRKGVCSEGKNIKKF